MRAPLTWQGFSYLGEGLRLLLMGEMTGFELLTDKSTVVRSQRLRVVVALGLGRAAE